MHWACTKRAPNLCHEGDAACVGEGPAIAALKDKGNEGSPVTCTTVDVDAVAEMGGMIEGGVAVNDEPIKVVVGF